MAWANRRRKQAGSPKPHSDRVIGDEESPSRFRLAPATHCAKFQDGHPPGWQILRSLVRIIHQPRRASVRFSGSYNNRTLARRG